MQGWLRLNMFYCGQPVMRPVFEFMGNNIWFVVFFLLCYRYNGENEKWVKRTLIIQHFRLKEKKIGQTINSVLAFHRIICLLTWRHMLFNIRPYTWTNNCKHEWKALAKHVFIHWTHVALNIDRITPILPKSKQFSTKTFLFWNKFRKKWFWANDMWSKYGSRSIVDIWYPIIKV